MKTLVLKNPQFFDQIRGHRRGIQREGLPVKVLVVPTNEKLEISLQRLGCIGKNVVSEEPR